VKVRYVRYADFIKNCEKQFRKGFIGELGDYDVLMSLEENSSSNMIDMKRVYEELLIPVELAEEKYDEAYENGKIEGLGIRIAQLASMN